MNNNFTIRALHGAQKDLKKLFQEYKHPDEELYRGQIDLSNFYLPPFEDIYNDIEAYMSEGIDMDIDLQNIYTTSFGWKLDTFIKLCWLTEEHLNNNLKNPLGGHHNPRMGKSIIHPGGSRQKVLKLWNVEKFDFYYFNTTGVKFDWMKDLQVVDVPPICYFVLVADHGSLIPHIHFDQPLITSTVPVYHEMIRNRIKSMNLISNKIKYSFLDKFDHIKKTNTVGITFKNPPSLQDKIQAFILACLGYSVTSNNFIIVNTFTDKKISL